MAKTNTHTKYFTSEGVQVKSVTTLIGQHLGWNKQMLIAWSRIQGLKGKDSNKVRDEAAEIGTLAHKYCESYIKKEKVDTSDYSENQIKKAIVAYDAFRDWNSQLKPEYVESEIKLISDKYKTGGTCDLILKLKNKLVIGDLKTSKAIYPEMIIQLGAYRKLYELQTGNKITSGLILRIDKEGKGFEQHQIPLKKLNWGWKVFQHILKIHDLKEKA
jgi:hypothetical protein